MGLQNIEVLTVNVCVSAQSAEVMLIEAESSQSQSPHPPLTSPAAAGAGDTQPEVT